MSRRRRRLLLFLSIGVAGLLAAPAQTPLGQAMGPEKRVVPLSFSILGLDTALASHTDFVTFDPLIGLQACGDAAEGALRAQIEAPFGEDGPRRWHGIENVHLPIKRAATARSFAVPPGPTIGGCRPIILAGAGLRGTQNTAMWRLRVSGDLGAPGTERAFELTVDVSEWADPKGRIRHARTGRFTARNLASGRRFKGIDAQIRKEDATSSTPFSPTVAFPEGPGTVRFATRHGAHANLRALRYQVKTEQCDGETLGEMVLQAPWGRTFPIPAQRGTGGLLARTGPLDARTIAGAWRIMDARGAKFTVPECLEFSMNADLVPIAEKLNRLDSDLLRTLSVWRVVRLKGRLPPASS